MNFQELKNRTIYSDEITRKAIYTIGKGYKGKAIVAFVDLLGFKDKIINNWDNEEDNPLLTLIELKSFLEIIISKIKTVRFYSYDNETLISEVEYPKILTGSDSFIFVSTVDETDTQSSLVSLLGVITTCLELWDISIDKGFTIRGGIEYGDLFLGDNEIVGNAFINSYILETNVASYSRIIISNNIKKLIDQNIDNTNTIIRDYFLRFIIRYKDNYLGINPVMKLANDEKKASETLNKLNNIISKISNKKHLFKYKDLIKRVKEKEMNLNKRTIFNEINTREYLYGINSIISSFKFWFINKTRL